MRVVPFAALGALFAAAFFWGMQHLISTEGLEYPELRQLSAIALIDVREERVVEKRERVEEPLPVEKPEQLTPVKAGVASPQQNAPQLTFEVPRLGLSDYTGNSSFVYEGDQGFGGVAYGLVPLVHVPPQYPYRAQQSRIEGFVQLHFTINEDGSVSDIDVVKAEPPNVFERAAVRAVARWRFQPRVAGGVAQRQRASQMITFKLSD